MSFHVQSTTNEHTGQTEITEVTMGEHSVVFHRYSNNQINVTMLSVDMPRAEQITLTPSETAELVKRLTDMLKPT